MNRTWRPSIPQATKDEICRLRELGWTTHRVARHLGLHVNTVKYISRHIKVTRAVEACEICGDECKVVADHCHDSGNARGVLCVPCNTGLGVFKDSPERLQAAIDYLTRYTRPEAFKP